MLPHHERVKELKVAIWPQNASDPHLIELHLTCFKNYDPWTAVSMRGFTLSKTMFAWVLLVKEDLHEYHDSGFSTRTLHCSQDQCY